MNKNGSMLGKTTELTGFYQALAKLQSNAFSYVLNGADEAGIKARALYVTHDLEALGEQIQQKAAPGQCPRGQRWDEVRGVCVDE